MPAIAIKATHINNLTDARYFAVFAEWIGFKLANDDPQALSLTNARELMGWVSGVRLVGEFGHSPIAYINALAEALQLDTIEVAQSTDLTGLSPIVSSVLRRVELLPDTEVDALALYLALHQHTSAAFVFDLSQGDYTAASLPRHPLWKSGALQQWCSQYRVILQLPFDAATMLPVIEVLQPFGIALTGSDEQQTGLKTFDELNELIELLGY
ncbi:MAG: hypothetical protein IPL33_09385 [Sphingobacteriales bacterium]|nr:hypothetical protein [Sphingobacteriales bacterium]MCC7223604.1 hypothetical protein [Chitinophagales bacterium]